MSNYVTITLDTTAPSNPTVSIENGAVYATNQLANLTIGTGDGTTAGYQMKIWGDVDTSYDSNVKATEATSIYITYSTTKQIKLLTGDGTKNIFIKIRDDVYNESAQATDAITLNTTIPTVTTTSLDVTKISKIAGKNAASFSFTADQSFTDYKVCVVGTAGADQSAGTTIPTTNGSTNTSGTAGNFASGTPINISVNGTDLQTASSGDGSKIVKVFVKNVAGLWSA